MDMKKYQPKEITKFWCSTCDAAKVDSDKPESGTFYVQFGHAYNPTTKAFDGEYVGVMYALCPECDHNI
jgi:hypothetical protein